MRRLKAATAAIGREKSLLTLAYLRQIVVGDKKAARRHAKQREANILHPNARRALLERLLHVNAGRRRRETHREDGDKADERPLHDFRRVERRLVLQLHVDDARNQQNERRPLRAGKRLVEDEFEQKSGRENFHLVCDL